MKSLEQLKESIKDFKTRCIQSEMEAKDNLGGCGIDFDCLKLIIKSKKVIGKTRVNQKMPWDEDYNK